MNVTVYKRCKRYGCLKSPYCEHPFHLRGRLKDNTPFSMPLDDYASPRMAAEERHVITKTTDTKTWRTRLESDLRAGIDPRKTFIPSDAHILTGGSTVLTVSELLDKFFTRHVEVETPASVPSTKSRIKVINELIGSVPVTVDALEKTSVIEDFRITLRKRKYDISAVNRFLEVLRSGLNWGRRKKFHTVALSADMFGIKKSQEKPRERRLSAQEEQALLSTCLNVMSTAKHCSSGPRLHDAIISALELPIRIGELLPIQNKHVDWEEEQILISYEKNGTRHTRWVPFDPEGRLAEILKRRKALGAQAFVFGTDSGSKVSSIQQAWDACRMIALAGIEPRHKYGPSKNKKQQGNKQCLGWTDACQKALSEIDLHWHDLRHEGACRLLRGGVNLRTIQLMLGHTTLQQTQKYLNVTDEELKSDMQLHWEGRREKLRLLQGGKTEATA